MYVCIYHTYGCTYVHMYSNSCFNVKLQKQVKFTRLSGQQKINIVTCSKIYVLQCMYVHIYHKA